MTTRPYLQTRSQRSPCIRNGAPVDPSTSMMSKWWIKEHGLPYPLRRKMHILGILSGLYPEPWLPFDDNGSTSTNRRFESPMNK